MNYHYIKENEKELIRIAFDEIDKIFEEHKREAKLPLNVLRDMMGKALTNSLDSKFYLSSIAPGYGKSKLVQEAVSAWVADGSLKKGGALIALSTLEELKDYRDRIALPFNTYAALTRDDEEVNRWGLGSSRADQAQVLFTTHQMLRSRLIDSSFAGASCFHYNGKPRALRVWDEGCIPAEPKSVPIKALMALPHLLGISHAKFGDDVLEFLKEVDLAKVGDVLTIPAALGDAARAVSCLSTIPYEAGKPLEALATLNGRKVEVGKENRTGITLFGCSKPLPDDLAPLFILDGSGEVRTTYTNWELNRRNLERLPAVKIDYSNLTIHLWKKGSGQEIMSDPKARQPIVDAIAKVIDAKEGEDCLVIHRTAAIDDVPSLLKKQRGTQANVKSRHWGLHHGTNEFRHVKTIILTGLLDYPATAYCAYHLAASGLTPGDTDKTHGIEIRLGELRHHLLQAISRGNVRNHDRSTDTCGACDAYLINAHPDIENLLRQTFPGCVIKAWEPVARRKTNRERLESCLKAAFSVKTVDRILKSEIRESLGITNKNGLNKIYLNTKFQKFIFDNKLSVSDHFYFTRKS